MTSRPVLVVFETTVADEAEHRRRVTLRVPDLADQVVPTWQDVVDAPYVPWDEQRDGERTLLETTDCEQALAVALEVLNRAS